MPYCSKCGNELKLGIEELCPRCGEKIQRVSTDTKSGASTNISNFSGDVLGSGFTGSGNIAGKNINYTVQGNVLNLHFSGNVSKEVIHTLQKILAVPTHVEQTTVWGNKTPELTRMQQQIKDTLDELSNIEQKAGTEIKEIKAGDLHISRDDLLLKETVLKDKVAKAQALNNKGAIFLRLEKYAGAIECFDKALEINPNFVEALNNKGVALYNLGKYDEALECYDKSIGINSN